MSHSYDSLTQPNHKKVKWHWPQGTPVIALTSLVIALSTFGYTVWKDCNSAADVRNARDAKPVATILSIGGKNTVDFPTKPIPVLGRPNTIVVKFHKGNLDGTLWIVVHPLSSDVSGGGYYPVVLPLHNDDLCKSTDENLRCQSFFIGQECGPGPYDIGIYSASNQIEGTVADTAAANINQSGSPKSFWRNMPDHLQRLATVEIVRPPTKC